MHSEGAKIIGIIERDAAIYNAAGFDPQDVKMYLKMHGSTHGSALKNYEHADEVEIMDPTFIMRKKCDIFAPCAGDGTLNMHNASHLKAKIVIEGANGPTTFKADQILESRGVLVIPDLLANVGGVTVSYFEWLKNLDHVAPGRMNKKYQEQQKANLLKMLGYRFPEGSPILNSIKGAKEIDIVKSGLEEIMTTAAAEQWKYAQVRHVSLRDACLGNSISKLAQRFEQSGMMI
jgi:glutamate dehydrogenase (NAD(P)+)